MNKRADYVRPCFLGRGEMENKHFDVIIIGGGASGIVAAIEARKQFNKVAIIEKESKTGRKILATGNGKCNMTNINAAIKDYHGSFSFAVKKLFAEFPPKYIMDYFEKMGLYSFADDFGRVYPKCKQASAVLDILRNKLRMNEIDEITCTKVTKIIPSENFQIIAENINNNNYNNSDKTKQYTCDKLIIACGGKSSPKLGSDGSIFKVIENLGHSHTKLTPALCPINVKSDIIKGIKGVRADGLVSVLSKGKVIKSEYGEIQFTENSISGICAFNLSYLDYDTVRVSLMPNKSKNEIIEILNSRREIFRDNRIEDFFLGMFNNKLSVALLKAGKMGSFNRKCSDITDKELASLARLINEFDFKATNNNDYSKSQVTKGGIPGNEINPNTMESLYIPNLYFCGEVIDIDGICGGYNLQFAFASGMKAGQLL